MPQVGLAMLENSNALGGFNRKHTVRIKLSSVVSGIANVSDRDISCSF